MIDWETGVLTAAAGAGAMFCASFWFSSPEVLDLSQVFESWRTHLRGTEVGGQRSEVRGRESNS